MTTDSGLSGNPQCPNCHSVLSSQAAFCASCGERIEKKNVASLLQDNTDIAAHYRITSLVRRRPFVSLFFAIDNQYLHPVGIRDIDISSLNNEARMSASEILQKEYDLLRRESIPSIMPVIDLRHFQGRLYVVSSWPSSSSAGQRGSNARLHTLQDVLQSGIGLPNVQVSLFWIEQLCYTLDILHRQQIVLGDLDPHALILGSSDYTGQLLLLVSWMPSLIRSLLPRTPIVNSTSNFSAPEVLLGKPEPRSDIYSLGAVLYLLLTGVPPEGPMARMHRSLPSPGEVNARINARLDDFVMKALSIDSSERYQSAGEMAEALSRMKPNGKRVFPKISSPLPPVAEPRVEDAQPDKIPATKQKSEEKAKIDTVLITPLPEGNLAAWEAAKNNEDTPTSTVEHASLVVEKAEEHAVAVETPQQHENVASFRPLEVPHNENDSLLGLSTRSTARFLQRVQRLVLGEQKRSTTAAAIIETPMRVQPDQPYTIRIQIMGRNVPGMVNPLGGFSRSAGGKRLPAGLSALIEGEQVFVEIRSVLFQDTAYIVQQATVHVPPGSFAAEVTIPMQPLSNGPSGRRERLYIFFMDEMHRPLYEKPFIVELFVSHLVQPGREGHNVLTIPI